MAKKTRKTKKSSTPRRPAQRAGFKALALHVTETKGRATFEALRAERPATAAFGLAASGVHINSGIHNFAAYNVMTARDGEKFLFKPSELAAMFYVALTQQLSRRSTFSDSRRGVVLAARSLFRALPQAQTDARARAVEAGFDAAGIR